MAKLRNISAVLLSLSSIIGLVRGYRMSHYPADDSIPFPYPEDAIKISVFSNYSILGWIVFSLIGAFSVLVILCILRRVRIYPYLIIMEGIFMTFLTLTHILLTQFGVIHLFILPLCIAIVIIGILQVPKEF